MTTSSFHTYIYIYIHTVVYIYVYIYRCSYRIILIIKHVPVKFLCFFSDVLTTSLGIFRLISGTDHNQLPLKVMRVPIARLSVDLAFEPLSTVNLKEVIFITDTWKHIFVNSF